MLRASTDAQTHHAPAEPTLKGAVLYFAKYGHVSYVAGCWLLGTQLLLLGAESRDVSGLFKTMLEHTLVLLEGDGAFRILFTTLAYVA